MIREESPATGSTPKPLGHSICGVTLIASRWSTISSKKPERASSRLSTPMRDLHEHRGRAALEQRLGGRHLPLESKYLSNLIGVNLQIEHLGAYHALRETRLVRVY